MLFSLLLLFSLLSLLVGGLKENSNFQENSNSVKLGSFGLLDSNGEMLEKDYSSCLSLYNYNVLCYESCDNMCYKGCDNGCTSGCDKGCGIGLCFKGCDKGCIGSCDKSCTLGCDRSDVFQCDCDNGLSQEDEEEEEDDEEEEKQFVNWINQIENNKKSDFSMMDGSLILVIIALIGITFGIGLCLKKYFQSTNSNKKTSISQTNYNTIPLLET